MGAIVKKYFIYFFSLLFNQWLMISSETEFRDNLFYSSILVLLNSEIIDVAKDGIHFFDAEFKNEEKTNFFNFTVPLTLDDIPKVSITQFSGDSGEYILILCKRILFIYDKDHNLKINFSLEESLGDMNNNIIAYKKKDEYLHYIIRYSDWGSHHILHFKFNLNSITSNAENIENSKENEIIIDNAIYSKAIYCLFMKPLSSFNINNDILNCFYVSKINWPNLIFSYSYDPENNFNEITSLRYNLTLDFFNTDPLFFLAITNKEKDKVLFYFYQGFPYWGTFDYTYQFSNFVKEDEVIDLGNTNYGHKLFYFRETNEYIAISSFGKTCQKFIIVYNGNLTIKYKGNLDFKQCWGSGPSNIFYNGNNYTIIYEDTRWIDSIFFSGTIISPIDEIVFIPFETSNSPTQPSNQNTNAITNKIITTEPKIITTDTIITTEPIIITTEPKIITTEPTIITTEPTEPKIITTEPKIITTEPTIITTEPEPTIITTELIIMTTEPTIITTEPKIITTRPTIITTELKIIATEPTIITTEPTIITTEPTIIITEPTIITTELKIITTEPTIITTEPTIITTEPTIITTEPTIITTEPTIITTEPTIITTEPTIITTEPTIITTEFKIITTEPTIITTEFKIITTEPTIITTEPAIITNEPTIITAEPIIITTVPKIIITESIRTEPTMNILESTIITTETENKNYTQNIKCKTSNYQSYILDLCLECNIVKNYFPAEYPDNSFLQGFTECYNSTTKPINFYFDNVNKKYKPCYETCLTCIEGGNGEKHNCLSCDANLRKEPDKNSTNCITECDYYYYYSSYGQYKCTNSSICPDEANLYIKKLKKCTNDCNKEKSEYKYQYGGQCLDECPSGTSNDSKGLCINENYNSCSKSKREIDLQDFLTNGGVDSNAKNYANEFHYTKKHVSYFYNNIYSIFLYKDSSCINELSLNIPKVDFRNCYVKVQQNLEPPSNDSIIIALIERANNQKKSSTSYFFYHPGTGQKLDAEKICKDEEVTIKESVLSQLNNSNVDLNSVLFLTQQDINIFNLSDEFYTDICYNFVSPNGKDVPLKDRIKAFYPNITLCDSGCTCKGVDLNSMESICECKFNDIMRSEFIEDNALLSNTIGEVFDLLRSSNLLILKCYKGIFKKENIVKSYGGFIIIGIVFFQIIFSLIFGLYDMNMIRKFLHNITEYFMALVTNLHPHGSISPNKSKRNSKKQAPPKRRKEKEVDKKMKNKRNNIKRNSCQISSYKRRKSSKRSIFIDEDYSKGISSNLRKTESKQLLSSKPSSVRNSQKLLRKQKSLQLYKRQSDINSRKLLRAKTLCGNMDIEEYLKPDLDDLEYDDAIKFDKRTFCEFFSERLSEKQIIMY